MPPAQLGNRSRRGCQQCRRGHHKCGEERPMCTRCKCRGLACEYNHVRWGCMITAESMKRGRRARPRPRAAKQPCEGEFAPDQSGPAHNNVDDHHGSSNQDPGVDSASVSSHTVSPSADEAPGQDHVIPSLTSVPAPLDPALSPHSVPALLFQHQDEAAAYSYYVERLAGDIQALDSLDNPYRKLSVLALSFPVLLYTTISCAAEHMHLLGMYPIHRAISQHNRAIRAIRVLLDTWQPSRPSSRDAFATDPGYSGPNRFTADQALLMAVLLQPAVVAFSHCDGPSAESYLDIGYYMIQELGYLEALRSPEQHSHHWAMESYFPRLLVQRFAMVDLGISVFRRRRPCLAPTDWFASPAVSDRLDNTQPSFRDMAGSSHTAFVFLLRATHLAMDVEEAERPHRQIYSDAIALETEIRIYDAQLGGQGGGVPRHRSPRANETGSTARHPPAAIITTTTADHVTAVCRAFAHTALLLLLRRCFREPSASPRVQHAVAAVFANIDMVPVTSNEGTSDPQQVRSGLDSSTCLPFYLTAREAQTKEDQEWVRRKNRRWRQVYPMPARGLLMEVAERIWAEREKGGGHMEERCRQIEESCKTYIF